MIETNSIHLLVVDDSDFFLTLITDQLESNYQITTRTAVSGSEALAELEDHQFDCVVSDYEMPSMSGLELHERVTEQYDVPFILLTSQGDEDVASRAVGAGVDDYLRKDKVAEGDPLEVLVNRIDNVVSQRQVREKYELLLNNSPDEITQIGADGTVMAANEAAAATFDISGADLHGTDIHDILPDAIATERIQRGREAIATGHSVTFQDSFDGRHFHNIVVPVQSGGEHDSFQLITRDITEQKEHEKALRAKTEELAVINRIVRHDINNDVQLLISWLDILADYVNEDGQEYLERIDGTCTHISELSLIVGDFVDSITEDGSLELEAVGLSHILENEIQKTRTAFDDATITVSGDSEEVPVLANELLSSVFGNLLSNAIRHNDSEEPRADIEVVDGDEHVRVRVADNGPGIPKAKRDVIFGRSEMGPESSGTGLGLYLVDTLVDQYNGEVWIEDRPANTAADEQPGTVFVVELQKPTKRPDESGFQP